MRWGWNFFNLMVKDGKLLGRYVISENRKKPSRIETTTWNR